MRRNDGSRHLAIVGASLAAIAVLGGTLTFTFHMGDLSGRSDAQAQGYAAAYPTDTRKQIADCWIKAERSAAQECVASAIQASREAQRSEAELSVQRQMSDSAFWALLVAVLMGLVTTIGTYLIFRQVELTRKAVEDTSQATKAVLEANEIAMNAQRPWLKFYPSAVANIFAPKEAGGIIPEYPGGIELVFTVEIENIGDSPCQYECAISAATKHSMRRVDVKGNIMPHDTATHTQKSISINFEEVAIWSYPSAGSAFYDFVLPCITVALEYHWSGKTGRTIRSYAVSEYEGIWGFRIDEARMNIPTIWTDQENAQIE